MYVFFNFPLNLYLYASTAFRVKGLFDEISGVQTKFILYLKHTAYRGKTICHNDPPGIFLYARQGIIPGGT